MTSSSCTAPQSAASGWLARFVRAVAAAHREAYVSRHDLDRRVLADIHAPQVPPTPDELRDAYRLWFGGDPARKL